MFTHDEKKATGISGSNVSLRTTLMAILGFIFIAANAQETEKCSFSNY